MNGLCKPHNYAFRVPAAMFINNKELKIDKKKLFFENFSVKRALDGIHFVPDRIAQGIAEYQRHWVCRGELRLWTSKSGLQKLEDLGES